MSEKCKKFSILINKVLIVFTGVLAAMNFENISMTWPDLTWLGSLFQCSCFTKKQKRKKKFVFFSSVRLKTILCTILKLWLGANNASDRKCDYYANSECLIYTINVTCSLEGCQYFWSVPFIHKCQKAMVSRCNSIRFAAGKCTQGVRGHLLSSSCSRGGLRRGFVNTRDWKVSK